MLIPQRREGAKFGKDFLVNYSAASCGVSNPQYSKNSKRGKPRGISPERLKPLRLSERYSEIRSWLRRALASTLFTLTVN